MAREILSDPSLDLEGQNIFTLQARLEDAVYTVCSRESARILKQILMDALRLEPAPGTDARPYLEGQEGLLKLIEERVEKLEGDLNETVYVSRLPEL